MSEMPQWIIEQDRQAEYEAWCAHHPTLTDEQLAQSFWSAVISPDRTEVD